MKQRVGITLGDPRGIGPEIAQKAIEAFGPDRAEFIVYADADQYASIAASQYRGTKHLEHPDEKERARFCLEALDRASEDALAGRIDALVTGPLDKRVVRTERAAFQGHTEYLGEKAGGVRTVMLLDNQEMSVILLTNHISLREVSAHLNVENALEIVRTTAEGLKSHFQIEGMGFSFLGVNPHAGEITQDAEETTILSRVIETLSRRGIVAEGPFAADGFLSKPKARSKNIVVASYHDQGLIPVKYEGLDRVVNITLGLPYLRVSPGHGVAYDILGQGIANPKSFLRAIEVAVTRRIR